VRENLRFDQGAIVHRGIQKNPTNFAKFQQNSGKKSKVTTNIPKQLKALAKFNQCPFNDGADIDGGAELHSRHNSSKISTSLSKNMLWEPK
jgi:hypothetical protein